jgi:hypothetical protein
VAGGCDYKDGVDEFGRLRGLLAESGHASILTRWPDAYGRVGAESVASYIQFLDSERRHLSARVRTLEEFQYGLQEQLYEERRERVNRLTEDLRVASQRLDEPMRKRRREFE